MDRRADIWAFGCVLFEMLTGRAAFARDTLSDTIAAVLEREPDWQAIPSACSAGRVAADQALSGQGSEGCAFGTRGMHVSRSMMWHPAQ